MTSDAERRETARRLREYVDLPDDWWQETCAEFYVEKCVFGNVDRHSEAELFTRLADLIEPRYKPDAEYEAWYNGLSHFGDERGGPSTIHELIEEIVWAALTVDLGPHGNTDSTGVDEGRVYTDKLFAEWEREALRLSGSIDRDALLALADELEEDACWEVQSPGVDNCAWRLKDVCDRIREALGVES